jgi:hypothetical protein
MSRVRASSRLVSGLSTVEKVTLAVREMALAATLSWHQQLSAGQG